MHDPHQLHSGLGGFWCSSCQVFYFLPVNFRPRGILGFQLSAIVFSFCLSISGFRRFWGSSSQVLTVRFQFRASGDSGAPADGYCLFFLSVNYGPQRIRGLQLPGHCLLFLSANFDCQSRASGDSGAPAVGYCLCFLSVDFEPQGILRFQLSGILCAFCLSILGFRGFWGSGCRVLSVLFCLPISGLGGFWGSSCRILSVLFVCQFRASRDSGAPAVRYCLFFLSVKFGPWGVWGSRCRVSSVLFVCQLRASGDSGAPAVGYCLFFVYVSFMPQGILRLQLSGIVCSFCLSISVLRGFWGSSCRVLSRLCAC